MAKQYLRYAVAVEALWHTNLDLVKHVEGKVRAKLGDDARIKWFTRPEASSAYEWVPGERLPDDTHTVYCIGVA
jgi:hypothetical protein